MSLLKTILEAQGGAAVEQLSRQFGLNSSQTNSALAQLIPALAGGLKKNVSQGGLGSLISALQQGNHQQYLDDPRQLDNQQTTLDGNAILGHILGNKEVSRQVASHASGNTGLDTGILKKMLPIVATMVMGGLSKQSASSNGALSSLIGGASRSSQPSAMNSLLTSFLDADNDGSIVDDLMAKLLK